MVEQFRESTSDGQMDSQIPVVVGVTGTKGKGSTVHFVSELMKSAERKCVTPTDVRQLMSASSQRGLEYVVFEITSYVLALIPMNVVCNIDCAILTNLGGDHIEFHGSVQNYVEAKKRLFAALRADCKASHVKWAILNRDDPLCGEFRGAVNEGVQVATYSAGNSRDKPSAWDSRAENIVHTADGTVFDLRVPGDIARSCKTPLHGEFNIYNILAAATCAMLYGVPLETVVEGMQHVTPPPGRFQILQRPSASAPGVVVDYAHTAESLEAALLTARALAPKGRIFCVFGCGGDCYRGKRPRMGEISSLLADVVILTSDNPRTEDPAVIISQISLGIAPSSSAQVIIEPDRKLAIEIAVAAARPQDMVLIAGKGHETTQTVGRLELPFSDAETALSTLEPSH